MTEKRSIPPPWNNVTYSLTIQSDNAHFIAMVTHLVEIMRRKSDELHAMPYLDTSLAIDAFELLLTGMAEYIQSVHDDELMQLDHVIELPGRARCFADTAEKIVEEARAYQ